MTNTDTRDIVKTVKQINNLFKSGCELIRVAVPDSEAARALGGIVERSPLPVIADIHFDHRLALEAMKAGAAGIRINPGNIGTRAKVIRIVQEARDRGVCIRIGVNAGSLEKDLRGQREEYLAEAMVVSALRHIELFERHNFTNLKISLKASDVHADGPGLPGAGPPGALSLSPGGDRSRDFDFRDDQVRLGNRTAPLPGNRRYPAGLPDGPAPGGDPGGLRAAAKP